MSLPVVLIADKLADSTVAALGDQVEVRWVDGPDREKLLAAVPDADALLVRSATNVDAEVLAAAPKLKIVARAGVGLDNVDVDAATARGVLVVNAPDVEHPQRRRTCGGTALGRGPREIPGRRRARFVIAPGSGRRSRAPRSSARPSASSVSAASASGGPAAGRVRRRTSSRTTPTCPQPRAAQLGIELLTLDELLLAADFISVHLPKTKETAGLMGKEALAKTKPGRDHRQRRTRRPDRRAGARGRGAQWPRARAQA